MMKTWKASYTVEASLVVPIMLWVFALAMQTGITMHEEIVEQQNIEFELWEVKEFYKFQSVGELIDDQS